MICKLESMLQKFKSIFNKNTTYHIYNLNTPFVFEINKNYLVYSISGSGKLYKIEESLKSYDYKHIPTILISLDDDFENIKYTKHCLDIVDINSLEKEMQLNESIHLSFKFDSKKNIEKSTQNLISIVKLINKLEYQHYRLIVNEFCYFVEKFFNDIDKDFISKRKNIILTTSYISSFDIYDEFIDEIYLGHGYDEKVNTELYKIINTNKFLKFEFKDFIKKHLKY